MNTSSTAATPTAPRPALHGLTALVVAAAGLLATGCGGTPGNRVSGAVTFDGRPVPAGKVYFKPDTEAGNTGATGFADIVDGRYDTGRDGARNVGTGAMVISVEGIDPHSAEEGASAVHARHRRSRGGGGPGRAVHFPVGCAGAADVPRVRPSRAGRAPAGRRASGNHRLGR